MLNPYRSLRSGLYLKTTIRTSRVFRQATQIADSGRVKMAARHRSVHPSFPTRRPTTRGYQMRDMRKTFRDAVVAGGAVAGKTRKHPGREQD
jgi:hypothetical protein